MSKTKYTKGRRIYNIGETTDKPKTVITSKGAKLKAKPNTWKEFGSGNGRVKGNESNPKKRKRLPGIKNIERNVLQYIIGQDIQVRQIITAIYRAINFKTINRTYHWY